MNITPIVAIEGGSGMGKSTLSLQIACNIMTDKFNTLPLCCIFYSLEQEPAWLIEHLKSHSYFDKKNETSLKKNVINLEDPKTSYYTLSSIQNKMLLARLTPRAEGYRNLTSEAIFQRRFLELEKSIHWAKRSNAKPFYFIDSLTAFGPMPLSRNQIHRLFTLFRMEQVPLLVTLERLKHWAIREEEIHFNIARYLADIIIKLDEKNTQEYYFQTIEITKTRYNRRILGSHLLKLKSTQQKATENFDARSGIVIYPSIHNHIVKSRTTSKRSSKETLPICISMDQLPLGTSSHENEKRENANSTQEIYPDTCIVITGPYGGHKFAVAMNLLLRTPEPKDKKQKLIVSFAEEREIKLSNVALLKSFNKWRRHLKTGTQYKQDGVKVWEQPFGRNAYIRLLNFRMGQIMPEEFLYIFNKYLNDNAEIDSVLFTDTAQIRTRFPALEDEPLFLPVLVDIVKSKGLYSLFIDVKENNFSTPALLSAADIRIYIDNFESTNLKMISIDNVRGKDYDRKPRIIDTQKNKRNYTLQIKKIENSINKKN